MMGFSLGLGMLLNQLCFAGLSGDGCLLSSWVFVVMRVSLRLVKLFESTLFEGLSSGWRLVY